MRASRATSTHSRIRRARQGVELALLLASTPSLAETPVSAPAAEVAPMEGTSASSVTIQCPVSEEVQCLILLRDNTVIIGSLSAVIPDRMLRVKPKDAQSSPQTREVPWAQLVAVTAIDGAEAVLSAKPNSTASETTAPQVLSAAPPTTRSTAVPSGVSTLPVPQAKESESPSDLRALAGMKKGPTARKAEYRPYVTGGIVALSIVGIGKLLVGAASYLGFYRGQWGWFIPVAGPVVVMANAGDQICPCAPAQAYGYGFGAVSLALTVAGSISLGVGLNAGR